MEYSELKPLFDFYHSKLAQTNLKFKRYLHDRINWDARIIGIKGPRGAGKTTILLQRILETHENPDEVFYMSLDNLWFKTHTPDSVISYLYLRGVTEFYIDEVHKYSDWSAILKELYDKYPDIKIVYTGSSLLEIDNSKTDLSRRQTLYSLKGMSFREFLEYEGITDIRPIPLSELLADHVRLSLDICRENRILRHFDDYIDHGCYPFYKDSGQDYHIRLAEVVATVLEGDLPAVMDVNYQTLEKARKLLRVISENVPFQPVMKKLAESLGTTRDTCLKLLYKLDGAGLLDLLTVELKSYKRLVNPEKIYLADTNLMRALGAKLSEGNIRETFFINQLSAVGDVTMPERGDFLVGGKFLFEVGGPGKGFDQIAGIPDSYLALADIETGYGSRVPLWMFGLLY